MDTVTTCGQTFDVAKLRAKFAASAPLTFGEIMALKIAATEPEPVTLKSGAPGPIVLVSKSHSSPRDEVLKAAAALRKTDPTMSEAKAFTQALANDPVLAKRYRDRPGTPAATTTAEKSTGGPARSEVLKRAGDLRAKDLKLSPSQAFTQALAANPELAKRYRAEVGA